MRVRDAVHGEEYVEPSQADGKRSMRKASAWNSRVAWACSCSFEVAKGRSPTNPLAAGGCRKRPMMSFETRYSGDCRIWQERQHGLFIPRIILACTRTLHPLTFSSRPSLRPLLPDALLLLSLLPLQLLLCNIPQFVLTFPLAPWYFEALSSSPSCSVFSILLPRRFT